MITPAQIAEARKLLCWLPARLADKAKITTAAVRRAEGLDGGSLVTIDTLFAIQRALETAGVEFIADSGGGAGVRLRKGMPT